MNTFMQKELQGIQILTLLTDITVQLKCTLNCWKNFLYAISVKLRYWGRTRSLKPSVLKISSLETKSFVTSPSRSKVVKLFVVQLLKFKVHWLWEEIVRMWAQITEPVDIYLLNKLYCLKISKIIARLVWSWRWSRQRKEMKDHKMIQVVRCCIHEIPKQSRQFMKVKSNIWLAIRQIWAFISFWLRASR